MRKIIIILTLCLLLFLAAALIYFLLSPGGSLLVVKSLINNYAGSEKISIGKAEGTLFKGMVFENISLGGLRRLPESSLLFIQKLEISLKALNLHGLSLKVLNGRLEWPHSENLLFYGEYTEGRLDVNIFSRRLDLGPVVDLFFDEQTIGAFSGSLSDIDIHISGSLFEPLIDGSLLVERLIHQDFSLQDSPLTLKLSLSQDDQRRLKGEVYAAGGRMSGQKTATVRLQPSRLLFDGNPANPGLAVRATAAVERVDIAISLAGTFERPELNLTSKPVLSQEHLLLMLATNKRWQTAESLMHSDGSFTELAGDFIDYFLFGGCSQALGEKLGIRDFNVRYDAAGVGAGLTKDVGDKVNFSYDIQRSANQGLPRETSQKIGLGYNLTPMFSLDAQHMMRQSLIDSGDDEILRDNQIKLRFKREF